MRASRVMNLDDDCAMAEPTAAFDLGGEGTSGFCDDNMHDDDCDESLREEVEPMAIAEGGAPPVANGPRTAADQGGLEGVAEVHAVQPPDLSSTVGSSWTAAEGSSSLPAEEAIYQRAESAYARGSEASVVMVGPALNIDVSVALLKLVKKVIHDLYERRRSDVCRSPERPDLRLSQEEAMGYLIIDLLRGAFATLPKEARDVGKRVDFYAGAEKKANDAAKAKAKTARSNARAKARRDASFDLEAKLQSIETEEQGAQGARLAKLVDLGLPAADSVVHEPRPPTVAEVEESTAAKLRRLRAAAARQAEIVKEAEVDAVAAKRLAERAAKERDAATALRRLAGDHIARRSQHGVSDEEWQRLGEEVVQAWQAYKMCAQTRIECDETLEDAIEAFEDAQAAVAAEERAQAQQAERERWEAEWAAAQAQRERECEEATARMEAMTLRSEAARERAERAQQEAISARHPGTYAFEMPAETRARLEADVAQVWEMETPPAQCKTISLVGVSPAGTRALAEQVGVAACDRSRILVGVLGGPDVLAPEGGG